ncbi:MAG: hypothetical protein IKJ91_01280 [Clostridia bacterium]|nr:hypothetical protein [Clostridia bacterium]
MTELEKIAYAKSFIDKLANGINPLDDTMIPEGDVINNVRLSRCFFYVSDILGQVYENGGIGKVEKTIPFSITPEQLANFEVSPYPISGSEISKKLDALVKNPLMKSFSVQKLNQWLIQQGLLCETTDPFGKPRKMPTEQGKAMGILTETKMGREGEYIAVLFDTKAQRFIVNNIYEILNA